ncbi:MAG TPA: HAMP domain-containing methyl-accepting chemotaxis protein [Ktedonobacterales bacterium]|nr:HAMP domain-containing methyl-accepting chemotaxis protein [Ktedonobacterales bacterium]
MDAQIRASRALGGRLNWLMATATLLPAFAIFTLGFWAIRQLNASSAGLPPETLIWSATFGLAVITALIVAGLWLRMRAMVKSHALELADVCRRVTTGERALRAPIEGDDEFAVLAAAVNAVLDGAPPPGTAAGSDADAATLQAQIEKLLQEVSAVGDGDLRVQAEVTPDTLGVLADSFNYMIEELAKVVGRVQATTFQVTNATRRLLDRSAEVSQASEAQAGQIAQTTSAVAQLADFVQLSASNALAAAEAARDALHNAEGGQQAVVQTIDGMVHIRENVQETSKKIKRLGERSQEVGEIVRLIEDIAEQTNLLALNAAIQSAMAGEHGRGFSVVAEEIRMLADRVTEATKKIATLVKGIQGDTYEAVVAMEESTQEVVNGSRLADEAGEALRSIFGAVDRQAKMIESIARAANERAQTSEAVAASMGRIAEITRQTNSATQDTTAAVSYLAELAEQLRASVATFRLPEQVTQSQGQGPALLPQPGAGYPPALNLPSLGEPTWGAEADALPALPAAASAAIESGNLGNPFETGVLGNPFEAPGMGGPFEGGGFEGFGRFEGWDGAYPTPQQPQQPQQQSGYPFSQPDLNEQFGQGPNGNGHFSPDRY